MAESFYYKNLEKADNLKDILSSYAEERKWDQRIENCRAAFIIPNGNRHDSGYNCFDIFVCVPDGTHDYSDGCRGYLSSNVAATVMIFHSRASTLEWTACILPALFAFGIGADSLLQKTLAAFLLLKTRTEMTKLFSASIMPGKPEYYFGGNSYA